MDERLLPTEPIRQFLRYVEAAEIVTLVGTGAIAYFSGELVPTVMAVGIVVGLAAWHGHHFIKGRFNSSDSQNPPNQDISNRPMVFRPMPRDPQLEATLDAIRDAKQHPIFTRLPKATGRGPKRVRKEAHKDLHRK